MKKLAAFLIGIFFVTGVFGIPGLGSEGPTLPMQIYGTVSVNGQSAPDGTAVQLKIRGDSYVTTTVGGRYGYAPNVLQIEDSDGSLSGKNVEIFINYKKVGDLVFVDDMLVEKNLETTTSCGDGYCLGSETQTSCSADCGGNPAQAAVTSGGGTGSSGGGGGGIVSSTTPKSNQSQKLSTTNEICIEQWECSDWSLCKDGKEKRLCRDNANCKTTKLKPDELRECNGEQLVTNTKQNNSGLVGAFFGNPGNIQEWIIIGFIVLVVCSIFVVLIFRKKGGNRKK